MLSMAERTFTAEQDHGRTDAPGRKVRFANVEDTQEVVVAARFMVQKLISCASLNSGKLTRLSEAGLRSILRTRQ